MTAEQKWICPHCRQTGVNASSIPCPPSCPNYIAPPTALVEPREPAQAETKKETSMNFGEAIQAMKDGKSVQRSGWNGKNMHIYLEDAFAFPIGDGVFKGQTRDYEPVICMFNAHGKHQPGWLANQPDILAEDWQVVDG